MVYKGSGQHLGERITCSFTSTLEIICDEFDTAQEKSLLEIRYLREKIDNEMATNNQEKGNLHTLKLQRDHEIRKMNRKFLSRRENK